MIGGPVTYRTRVVRYTVSTVSCPLPFTVTGSDRIIGLSTAIANRVDEAFKGYRYVPYTQLTHSARSKAARGEDSSFIITPDGFATKPLDRSNKLSISVTDWMAASKMAEDRTRSYHGDERADALASHHQAVLGISVSHSWLVAMYYDTQQRELAHSNLEHNLTGLDTAALTIAFHRAATTQYQPSLHPSAKRSAPSDFQTSPRKKSTYAVAGSNNCFRCGFTGHLTSQCTATTTTTGRPVAPLASNGKSRNALAAPDGRHFCFNWANNSTCVFGADCRNVHSCSICGDSSHGAASCKNRN